MLAYWIPTENRYVRTQGEAKKLGFGEATEIPTDKDGLLNFLNDLRRELKEQEVEAEDTPCPECPKCLELPAREVSPMDATSILSNLDNPKLDLDTVIESIANMKGGHALKRVAGAVAMRFEELSK